VCVIPVLACRGREAWRSNFLVPLVLRLRDFLPVHKVRVRQRDLGLIYAGVAFQVVLSSRAELATF